MSFPTKNDHLWGSLVPEIWSPNYISIVINRWHETNVTLLPLFILNGHGHPNAKSTGFGTICRFQGTSGCTLMWGSAILENSHGPWKPLVGRGAYTLPGYQAVRVEVEVAEVSSSAGHQDGILYDNLVFTAVIYVCHVVSIAICCYLCLSCFLHGYPLLSLLSIVLRWHPWLLILHSPRRHCCGRV